MQHYTVMEEESVTYLGIRERPNGIFLDTTCGLGGHTMRIARELDGIEASQGWVLANDRDAESLAFARERAGELGRRIRFHHGPFSGLRDAMKAQGIERVDGILADLGVSRWQLTSSERGFSLRNDGPIDMRMDRGQELTAADIVNFWSERELADLIFIHGEERRARQIAKALVRARPLRSTKHLADVVASAAAQTGSIHPATKVFQALRIVVNNEFGELDNLLEAAPALLNEGGRMVVISFHSLEARRCKVAFQALAKAGRARILTKHVVVPSERELAENAASRSAMLRAMEVV